VQLQIKVVGSRWQQNMKIKIIEREGSHIITLSLLYFPFHFMVVSSSLEVIRGYSKM